MQLAGATHTLLWIIELLTRLSRDNRADFGIAALSNVRPYLLEVQFVNVIRRDELIQLSHFIHDARAEQIVLTD